MAPPYVSELQQSVRMLHTMLERQHNVFTQALSDSSKRKPHDKGTCETCKTLNNLERKYPFIAVMKGEPSGRDERGYWEFTRIV